MTHFIDMEHAPEDLRYFMILKHESNPYNSADDKILLRMETK